MKIAITGANSSVGQNLLAHILRRQEMQAIAGVRSSSAFGQLPHSDRIQPQVIRYDDAQGLAATLQGADCVVHLAGILIESRQSTYQEANVDATAAVVKAATRARVRHLVFVSVVGADAASGNAYFRSKGKAEQLVSQSGLSASILRTPMLLGPGSAGALSLVATASKETAGILGGGHYQARPLDIDDLSEAILICCKRAAPGAQCYELVGPEPITFRDLVIRTAQMLGKPVAIKAVPIWLATLVAAVTSRLKGGGFTPTVIDVITRDEKVTHNADEALGLRLTPLDDTLRKLLNQ